MVKRTVDQFLDWAPAGVFEHIAGLFLLQACFHFLPSPYYIKLLNSKFLNFGWWFVLRLFRVVIFNVWSFFDVKKSTILLKSLPISSLYLFKVNSSVLPGMVFATSPFSNVKTYSHSVSSRSLWNVLNLLIAFWSRLLYDSFVLTLIATLLSRTGFKYSCLSLHFSIPMLMDTCVSFMLFLSIVNFRKPTLRLHFPELDKGNNISSLPIDKEKDEVQNRYGYK